MDLARIPQWCVLKAWLEEMVVVAQVEAEEESDPIKHAMLRGCASAFEQVLNKTVDIELES